MGKLRLKACSELIGLASVGKRAGLFAARNACRGARLAAGMMLAKGMAAPKLKRPPKNVSLPVETSVAWKLPPNFQVCAPRRCERLSVISYSRWIVRDGRKMSRLKNPKP